MVRFVAYYRVSTDRQGASGLGLDAQRDAVTRYIAGRGELAACFTEIESGRKDARPELRAALDACRQHRATLLIARLDRLSRNVALIANLMNSDVDFVAVDMPQANRLTIHILAAVAEHERELISKRTKEALTAAKLRGVRLGNPRPKESLLRARAARHPEPYRAAPEVLALMTTWREQGKSLRAIARGLNSLRIHTATGCEWYAKTVRTQLYRCAITVPATMTAPSSKRLERSSDEPLLI